MRASIASLLPLSLLLWSQPTQAADSYLSCQVELKQQDCTAVSTPWPASQALLVGASCTECSGGGSDISCSPAELLNPAVLALETAGGAEVAGSFSQIGSCDFGIPLFRFSGSLSGGTAYNLVATIPGHEKTLLLAFSTSGGGIPGADGAPPTGDGAVSRADGSSASSGDGGGGTISGDGGNQSAPDSPADDGCSCQLLSSESPLPSLLLTLLAALLLLKRRLTRRSRAA